MVASMPSPNNYILSMIDNLEDLVDGGAEIEERFLKHVGA